MSLEGNFYGSTLVVLRPGDPAAQSLSIAAALALVEAIDVAVPNQPVTLKWPNDVMLRDRKLAGILLERQGDRIAVGFGVNLARAPRLGDRETASLDGRISAPAFAPLLAASFARLLSLWRDSEPGLLAQAWLVRAHPRGTKLSVHASAGEIVDGRFEGIEPDGALRLSRADGAIEIIRAGDVHLD